MYGIIMLFDRAYIHLQSYYRNLFRYHQSGNARKMCFHVYEFQSQRSDSIREHVCPSFRALVGNHFFFQPNRLKNRFYSNASSMKRTYMLQKTMKMFFGISLGLFNAQYLHSCQRFLKRYISTGSAKKSELQLFFIIFLLRQL